MFIETVKTEGLAHLSYLIGDDGQAAVIDPRRDCDGYLERAQAQGCRITHIFETHRNEDLASGASVLAQLSGAEVHHGPNADGEVVYADTVREGADFTLGALRLRVLETPGHTDDSISIAFYDTGFGDRAVGVFTGDALFVGDVGRTDFYPERAEEVAGLLYDSLQKLLDLGDQAVIYPAHGAGSVCGDNMADREVSTLGYERRFNPLLTIASRSAFVERKVAEEHGQPPYFRRMEQLNLTGAPAMPAPLAPPPLLPDAFERLAEQALVLDVRDTAAYLGAHLAASVAIPAAMLPAFAGWLLDPDQALLLLASDATQAATARRHLARIGYDRVEGFLAPPLPAWAAGGRAFDRMAAVDAATVADRVKARDPEWCLLDVRKPGEVAGGRVPGAEPVFLGELPRHLEVLDPERHYTLMCASGARATIGASLLRRAGFSRVDVFLGSMGAWRAAGGEIV